MTDREKVIEELENYEPYARAFSNLTVKSWIVIAVLDLLKEQEAVEPKKESDGNPERWASWWYVCGNCGGVIDCHDKYCRHCGREVKWND